tara:strand:+ start:9793 stop:10314 length:522 start_codon:yes stop_codon:yes gene_type:complete
MKKLLFFILLLILTACAAPKKCCSQICDSLSYGIFPNTILTVTPSSGGLSGLVSAIDWNFTACNAIACYIPQGNNPFFFPLINMSDTVKLCYDAFIHQLDSTTVMCNHCDSLVYDFNLYTWAVYKTLNNTTDIQQIIEDKVLSNKMYDVYGKELLVAPIRQIYIQNRKKYFKL